MKQHIALSFTFCLCILLGCAKQELPVPETVKNLMQSENCSCEPFIDLYRWKGQQVFVLKYKGPACNWTPTYIKADGSYLQLAPSYSLDLFQQEATFISNIWTCGK